MEENNEEQVKSILEKANNALEAHKFTLANNLCEEGLKIDCENPNLYLIQLLAKYEVTEIENLKNCDIDFYSDVYVNLRFFANDELNKDLDAAIFGKTEQKPKENLFIKTKSFFNEFLDSIKEEFVFPIKRPNNLVDFCKQELEEFRFSEEIINKNQEDNIYSASSFITLISYSFCILIFPFTNLVLLGDDRIFSFICFLLVTILFFLKLKKVYEHPVVHCNKPKTANNKYIYYLIKIFINSIIAILCFIIIHFLYIASFGFIVAHNYNLLGLIIGIIPAYIVFFQYQKTYCLLENIRSLFKSIFSTSKISTN